MPAKNTLKNIFPVILLTIVVAISVTLLFFTDQLLRGKIEWQREQKIECLLSELFPEMSRHDFDNEIYTIYSADETKVGYAFLGEGYGYGGKMYILVGLENDLTLKGISIVSQLETPGLGSRIKEHSFTDQFAGIDVADVALRQDGGEIDAITGATMSSRAVVKIVSTTAIEKVKLIKELEEQR